MRRVILKCKLKSHDSFEKKLSDIELKFSPVYWQHDRVYVPRGYQKERNFPRLVMRTEVKAVDKPAKYYFILKRHIEDSGVDIVEQTPVTDYEKTVNIIFQLGFKPIAEVSRRRKELDMGGGTFIYLDKIENNPGYHAKIETNLVADDSVSAVKDDLRRTFTALGESNFESIPYFEL